MSFANQLGAYHRLAVEFQFHELQDWVASSLRLHDFHSAITLCERALESTVEPSFQALLLIELGLCYGAAGQLPIASSTFNDVIQSDEAADYLRAEALAYDWILRYQSDRARLSEEFSDAAERVRKGRSDREIVSAIGKLDQLLVDEQRHMSRDRMHLERGKLQFQHSHDWRLAADEFGAVIANGCCALMKGRGYVWRALLYDEHDTQTRNEDIPSAQQLLFPERRADRFDKHLPFVPVSLDDTEGEQVPAKAQQARDRVALRKQKPPANTDAKDEKVRTTDGNRTKQEAKRQASRSGELAALLTEATESALKQAAFQAPRKRILLIAETFTRAANRRHWKECLGLDLGQLQGNRAIDKVNRWLEENEGSYCDASDATKDEVVNCLRGIRDDLSIGFVVAGTENDETPIKVTLKNDFDRLGKRRFKYVDVCGRHKRSQGLPEVRAVAAKKISPTP